MRGWDKLRQRAVYQPYILAMQVVTLICLRWASPGHANVAQDLRGRLDRDESGRLP